MLFYVLFVFVLFYVLFMCECVLKYYHRVSTQLQLTNISYHIISGQERLLSFWQNLLSSSWLHKNTKIKAHRTIILPVVMYGWETWSLAFREERRLRVFENRVLRRIFGPKRDDVTGEWRKLRNEELNDPYFPPNIVRVIKERRMR